MEYEVVVKEVAPEHLASTRGTYPIADIAQVMSREFGRVMGALAAEGVQPSGGALAIYHGWTEDTVDLEVAFTIRGVFFPQERRSGVKAGRVPGGKVAFTKHVGRYDRLEEAYKAIQAFAQANGLELAGTMWERYLTDPAVEPDLDKHVTEVFWPVA